MCPGSNQTLPRAQFSLLHPTVVHQLFISLDRGGPMPYPAPALAGSIYEVLNQGSLIHCSQVMGGVCGWICLTLHSPYVPGQCPSPHIWFWFNHLYTLAWFLIFGFHSLPNPELSLLESRPWFSPSFSAHLITDVRFSHQDTLASYLTSLHLPSRWKLQIREGVG